jgi:hypothetical protein
MLTIARIPKDFLFDLLGWWHDLTVIGAYTLKIISQRPLIRISLHCMIVQGSYQT